MENAGFPVTVEDPRSIWGRLNDFAVSYNGQLFWYSFCVCVLAQVIFLFYFIAFHATAISILLFALVTFSVGVLYKRDQVGASACGGAQLIFCAYLFTCIFSGELWKGRGFSGLEKSTLLYTTIIAALSSATATASGFFLALSLRAKEARAIAEGVEGDRANISMESSQLAECDLEVGEPENSSSLVVKTIVAKAPRPLDTFIDRSKPREPSTTLPDPSRLASGSTLRLGDLLPHRRNLSTPRLSPVESGFHEVNSPFRNNSFDNPPEFEAEPNDESRREYEVQADDKKRRAKGEEGIIDEGLSSHPPLPPRTSRFCMEELPTGDRDDVEKEEASSTAETLDDGADEDVLPYSVKLLGTIEAQRKEIDAHLAQRQAEEKLGTLTAQVSGLTASAL